ncbi:MAG: hypothetical protein PHE66_09800, partial [Syntrophaceticus schinkii]|nr:hypothetical protein [Syntrophaceticus schinkii]
MRIESALITLAEILVRNLDLMRCLTRFGAFLSWPYGAKQAIPGSSCHFGKVYQRSGGTSC